MEIRTLNPNKRNHRKLFVKKCEQLLDKTPIEAELNEVEMNVDRNKIEQIDRDVTYILNKARSVAEGERKGIRGCTEKLMIRSSVKYWTAMIKKKEGKSVSQLRLNKWKKDARLGGNDDNKRLSECKNEWSKALEEWENSRRKKQMQRERNIRKA